MPIQLKNFVGFENWSRPAPHERSTYVPDVDDYIESLARSIKNSELKRLLVNTFTNTLDTTLYNYEEQGLQKSFVITGDIPAMWLRDSTAQVWQYLPLLKVSADIQNIFQGLIRKQSECITLDPYANAFYHKAKYGYHKFDLTPMKAGVHERKWELDSLCYHLHLCTEYFSQTQDTSIFDLVWLSGFELILKTFRVQQRKHGHGPYVFDRITTNRVDTLSNLGYGPRYKATGMIASSFRASDDACVYPFNIPANMYARHVLAHIQPLLSAIGRQDLVNECQALCSDIQIGLDEWAIENSKNLGAYFRFEVDGRGNSLAIDEPNSPNLSSLAYLGVFPSDDATFVNTARLMNGPSNPWYFSGSIASGVGSPHTGKDMIWPMAMILNMFNQSNTGQIEKSLMELIISSSGTGLLHESFHKDNAQIFTRPWFAWCNSLFSDVVIKLMQRHPGLIEEY